MLFLEYDSGSGTYFKDERWYSTIDALVRTNFEFLLHFLGLTFNSPGDGPHIIGFNGNTFSRTCAEWLIDGFEALMDDGMATLCSAPKGQFWLHRDAQLGYPLTWRYQRLKGPPFELVPPPRGAILVVRCYKTDIVRLTFDGHRNCRHIEWLVAPMTERSVAICQALLCKSMPIGA